MRTTTHRRGLAVVAFLALLIATGCNPFGGDNGPTSPEAFLFNVDIQADYVGGVPGTSGNVRVICGPSRHPSCRSDASGSSDDCRYELLADRVSRGGTLVGQTFALTLASDPVAYTFQCVHRPTNSQSVVAEVLVP